jgi:IS5 family transposase
MLPIVKKKAFPEYGAQSRERRTRRPTPMRRIMRQEQPLMQGFIEHEHGWELAVMSEILDEMPEVLERIEADLTADGDGGNGRPGMSAEEVLRALVVKQMNGYSYEELSFHLADSTCYRTFCRLGAFEKTPSRSTLQENIKRLRAETLEAMNQALLSYAKKEGVEDGSTVRGDCTVVASNIHHPMDSWLLWDTVRVGVRLLKRAAEYGVEFTNHERRAKRRWREIGNARSGEERVSLYHDLLKVSEKTLEDAQNAVSELERWEDEEAVALSARLRESVKLGCQVVAQTRRRVFEGESVPSPEKVVSIFEPHTDIIVRGRREVEYGHKVCLTSGVSSMVLDCKVLEGNPADTTLAEEMIERHGEILGEVPEEVAFDGGFASQANVRGIKKLGVRDVAFSKRCGLSVSEMVRSSWVYKRLRNFRAGIEGVISFLKRCFGLGRCLWRGFESFKAYVWASILSANLLTVARHALAR